MTIEDDLLKLNELREKGALTSEEFAARKQQLLGARKTRFNLKGIWWKIPLLLISIFGLVSGITTIDRANRTASSNLPTCASPEAETTLRDAFNQSQFARTDNLSAVEIQEARSTAGSQKQRVNCTAKLLLNNLANAEVAYAMEPRSDGTFMLTFEVRRIVQGSGIKQTAALAQLEDKGGQVGAADEVCRMAFNHYYLTFDKRSGANDPVVMHAQCAGNAQKLSEDELINFDVSELLKKAAVEPDRYRQIISNALQFACVRNSTDTAGMSYPEFKKSQCNS